MRIDKTAQLHGSDPRHATYGLEGALSATATLLAEQLRALEESGASLIRATHSFDCVTQSSNAALAPNLSLGAFSEGLKCSRYIAEADRPDWSIKIPAYKARSPVSLNFFKDREFRIRSWSDQDLRALPLAEIIRTEAAHLDSHVPLYHATQVSRWAMNHFITRLIDAANPQGACSAKHWLRNPAEPRAGLPRLSSLADMRAYLDDTGVNLNEGLDNRKSISSAFLSCNPSIMQNSDVASEECTADFYYSNSSVNELNATQVEMMLSSLQPALTDQERLHLASCLIDAICAELKSDRGVLYQFFIPHSEVRDLVYVSGQNGIPHPQHRDSLATLLALQTGGARHLADASSLQARLYLHPLMDLSRQSDVRLNLYHDLTDAQVDAFERRIDPVILRLLA